MEPIQIRMLGEFSLQFGKISISDTATRSKRVWNLLAYLICNRNRKFSIPVLVDLLWGSNSGITNPENALRITLHRLRSQLDQLWPGAGRELILRSEEGYGWNPEVPIQLDWEQFEELCLLEQSGGDARLETVLEALSLYKGEFLPKYSSEMWVIPVSSHFHNRYLLLTLEAVDLLSARDRHQDAIRFCRKAVEAEPYHEPLYQALMKELAATGNIRGATAVYEHLCRLLSDAFGVPPSDETRAVYRAATHHPEDRVLTMDEVLAHLQEPRGKAGAMQCDYDYFKVLCYAAARTMEHSDIVTHVALLNLTGSTEKPMTKRTQNRIMEQLGDFLRVNLRRGDVISRCSASQYIIILPQANFENSRMVCRRVIAAFFQIHPHISAKIQYMIQPLTPDIRVP